MWAELIWRSTFENGDYGCFTCETPLIGEYVPEMEYTFGSPKLRFVCECGYNDMRYGQINQMKIKLVVQG